MAKNQGGLITHRIAIGDADTARKLVIGGIVGVVVASVPEDGRLPNVIDLEIKATLHRRSKIDDGEAYVIVTAAVHTADNVGVKTETIK